MYRVDEETRRVRNQVAILLACTRTRLDKSRWMLIQRLLQQAGDLTMEASPELSRQLLQERKFLSTLVEESSGRDAAIMMRRTL